MSDERDLFEQANQALRRMAILAMEWCREHAQGCDTVELDAAHARALRD